MKKRQKKIILIIKKLLFNNSVNYINIFTLNITARTVLHDKRVPRENKIHKKIQEIAGDLIIYFKTNFIIYLNSKFLLKQVNDFLDITAYFFHYFIFSKAN